MSGQSARWVTSLPVPVLGGAVIAIVGMVCAAGIRSRADVEWTRRNMPVLALALSAGMGLQQAPAALQHLPDLPRLRPATGLLPAALIAIVVNLVLPEQPEG